MDVVTASAALFAAVSAGASAYTGWKMRQDVRLSEASSRYELVRSFETVYDNQYEAIFRELGGWPDPVEVDPKLRRVVHDIVVTLSSIYNARSLGLLSETEADYLGVLFSDWLRAKPEAYRVWREVFDTDDQRESLPRGFSDYVEKLVGDEATPASPTLEGHPR